MTYKQMKWLILTIPTLTIGIWEYVRHEFLLPYISMDLGNWLAPVLVLVVTLLLLTQLFTMIEHNHEELNRAKAVKAVLEEREKIARELHDGIAQTLFFLNAQVSRMERMKQAEGLPIDKLKASVHHANDYVRQAIANLRYAADVDRKPWLQGVESLIDELLLETDLQIDTKWEIPESLLSTKDKVELLAIVREALLNIHKHADATFVHIQALTTKNGWICQIKDNGKGFELETAIRGSSYGLKMMRDRVNNMSWHLNYERKDGETRVTIKKEAT
ncbi:sensor histidine kinase [Paenibacillus taichungensis]|uniref:sensor histidine kinase n=1 Tax=Paenibacillus taichungensis TaxID=484184 RepID=UPI002871D765|nr:histidine kinase [Paenibacillus taichungensis]MDR9748586.1 histidine kinase [Paenibacillus taichungensis]